MLPLKINQDYPENDKISKIRDFFNNFAGELARVIPDPLKYRLMDLRDYACSCTSTSDGLMEEFNTQVPIKDIRNTFDMLFEGAKDTYLPQLTVELVHPKSVVANAMVNDFLRESFHNLRYAKNAYVRFLNALYQKKRGTVINTELNNFYMYFNNARDSFIEAVLSTGLAEQEALS